MIRPAVLGDAEMVRAIVQEAYEKYVTRIGKPPGPMLDDYELRIASGQVWVACLPEGGEIIGLVVLEDQPDGLLLDNVAVRPAAQGQGIGKRLIAFAEDEARRRGYRGLRLYTHMLMVENIALYGSLGFTEIGRMQREGYYRVSMSKQV